MKVYLLQAKYIISGLALLPVSPLLYIQGRITRWKVGLLPEAEDPCGVSGTGERVERLAVIGDSTVAGLGARTHSRALAGCFAKALAEKRGCRIEWFALGKNGATAGDVVKSILPKANLDNVDHILFGVGGNDVLKLTPPVTFRKNIQKLIYHTRQKAPRARIYFTNCPMIIASPVLPQPIKRILWELSKMHDKNMRMMSAESAKASGFYYFPQPTDVTRDGFFADGIHPSEKGYADWAEAMVEYFCRREDPLNGHIA
ncbi:MAG TPA: SGNH/GDSL hydrolase family protein [Pyrinomonadaceae bacterium]|nr:SGNH/GDSL hydrolase family protein [Pyrinomonadaceae bacterium]